MLADVTWYWIIGAIGFSPHGNAVLITSVPGCKPRAALLPQAPLWHRERCVYRCERKATPGRLYRSQRASHRDTAASPSSPITLVILSPATNIGIRNLFVCTYSLDCELLHVRFSRVHLDRTCGRMSRERSLRTPITSLLEVI